MFVYFDNNATTPVDKEVAELIYKYMVSDYANPNSIHGFGNKIEKMMEDARELIAEKLDVMPYEIYFTSCASESINWAIRGICKANFRSGKHIVSSAIEHSATINTLKELENDGYTVTLIKTDKSGVIDLKELQQAIREDTVLVSIMAANNETGTLEPVEKIADIIKSKNKNTYFHVDGVQAIGKIPFSIRKVNCDMASFSAHKFHGPKGVGISYKKEGIRIFPYLTGGSQERGMRGGTQNTAGIIGSALAMKKAYDNLEDMKRIDTLRHFMAEKITQMGGIIATPLDNSVPNTLAVIFEGVRADSIVSALSDEGIFVSTSSACSSKSSSSNRVMHQMGYTEKQAQGNIRISLSHLNNAKEVDYFLEKLKNVLNFLKFNHSGV
jgi:cysteine desulfurase